MIRFTLFYKTDTDADLDEPRIREQAWLMALAVQDLLKTANNKEVVPFEVREYEMTDRVEDFFVECQVVRNDDRAVAVRFDETHVGIRTVMSEYAHTDQMVGCLVVFLNGNYTTTMGIH